MGHKLSVFGEMRRHPALQRYHEYVVKKGAEPKIIGIDVKIADENLMYFQADNVEGYGHFILHDTDSSLTATKQQYLCAVGGADRAWRQMSWGLGDTHFGKDIFLHPVHPDHAKYVFVVTHYNWYKEASEAEQRNGKYQGEHVSWEIRYTIYYPPPEGFRYLIANADIKKNVELTTRTLTNGLLMKQQEFEEASEILQRLAKKFEEKVYKHGFRELVRKSELKGMSGIFNGVKLMSWQMCGRLMITFEAPNYRNPQVNDSFSIIGLEPPHKAGFGWKSIYATCDSAQSLVHAVINEWQRIPRERQSKHHKGDEKVCIG